MSLSQKLVTTLFEIAGVSISDSGNTDIIVHDHSFYSDVLFKGSLGLGESYMDGKWTSDNIDEVIYNILKSGFYQKISSIYNSSRLIKNKFMNLQDRIKARDVIDEHYDLPVEFFAAFLDPYLQYTRGLFEDTNKLNEAQIKKMHLICQKLDLKKDQRVLDIGAGWGGLARFMIENYSVKPTVVTLSKKQADFIRNTLGKYIEVWECDYRDIPDRLTLSFDAVSTVGMLEHVGFNNYSYFMKIVHKSLKNNGKFLLHTLYTPYSVTASNPWTDKYIFPNGELAPKIEIMKNLRRYFNPKDPSFEDLTSHYPPTLISWDNNLMKEVSDSKVKMPEKKIRKWHYYFMSYAGSLKAGHVRVGQILYQK